MARRPLSPNALESGRVSASYATFSSDIDLLTAVPTSGTATGAACRHVYVRGVSSSGTGAALAVVYADGSTDVITDCIANEKLDLQLVKILASGTTGIARITVVW